MLISVEMSTFVPQKSAKKLFFIEVQTRVGLCTTLASGALFDLQENQLCTHTIPARDPSNIFLFQVFRKTWTFIQPV